MTTDSEPNLLASAEGILAEKNITPAELSQQLSAISQGAVSDAAYELMVEIHEKNHDRKNPILEKLERAHKEMTDILHDQRSFTGNESSAQQAIRKKIVAFGQIAIETNRERFTTLLKTALSNRI